VRDTDVAKIYLYVAYVAMTIHICYNYLFKMFYLLRTYICCNYFYVNVAYVVVAIHISCKRMFQIFHQKVLSCCPYSMRGAGIGRYRVYMCFISIQGW
jgi:hypothetical protein